MQSTLRSTRPLQNKLRLHSKLLHSSARVTMKVIPVPCRADNYMYIVTSTSGSPVAVVDPYDPAKLEAAAKEHNIKLGDHVWTTHWHDDHSGGNSEFKQKYPSAEFYAGSEKSKETKHFLKHGDKFKLGDLEIEALHTPCHTQDHICFFVKDAATGEKAVFTGDTLFTAGCGRFFEGTAEEMHRALNTILADLPDDTITYVGHEYLKGSLKFAKSVEPDNASFKTLDQVLSGDGRSTGKFTIADEKTWNPFMRLGNATIKSHTKTEGAVDTMQKLRDMKNSFK